jgi:hypothetical protein
MLLFSIALLHGTITGEVKRKNSLGEDDDDDDKCCLYKNVMECKREDAPNNR